MANIQLYTGDNSNYYSQEQIDELNKPLHPRLISTRKGGSNATLKYIAGHNAIDQANRIFGHGNWAYRPLSCEQVVLIDPLTGEAVGIEYKAMVELTVRGAIAPIVDIGSQPVATWNVEDQIMGRRINDAKYAKPPRAVDESPFTLLEKKNARAVIVEAHEQAKKGAVTDAMKRALRAFGDAFGNGLYGDGHVDISVTEGRTVEAVQQHAPRQIASVAMPTPADIAAIRNDVGAAFAFKDEEFEARWEKCKATILGRSVADPDLSKADIAKIRTYTENAKNRTAGGGR